MNFQASEADLLYWKTWIEKIGRKQRILSKNIKNNQTREEPREKGMEQANLEKPKVHVSKKKIFQIKKSECFAFYIDLT